MDITLAQLLIIELILFLSSMIQSIIGFAFNLLAIPLLIWSGLGLSQTVALTSIPILIQTVTSTWKLRKSIVKKDIVLPTIVRFITIPIGLTLLYYISSLNNAQIKKIVGIVLLIIIFTQLFIKFKPKERLPIFWDIVAFGLSGLMLGALAMGGPPVALWLMTHNWNAMRIRAFLSALFAFAAPLQIGLLYYKFGNEASEAFLLGFFSTPIVYIGATIGVKVGNKLNRELLKNIIMGFLFITALMSIFSS